MRREMIIAVCVLATAGLAQANMFANPSFENVPGSASGQGILPSDWVPAHESPDTYSNDGSYGLPPDTYDNFKGVLARDGIRWVAGWSSYSESFGQWMGSYLTSDTQYTMSGWLHQAVRSDLNNPGGYNIYLTATPGVHTEHVGFLGPTTSVAAGWGLFEFDFTATSAMSTLNFIEFVPTAIGSAYPGLDAVSLTVVPAPGAVLLGALGLGTASLKLRRRRT